MERLSTEAHQAKDFVNVIIVNYNCWRYTIDCIYSLLKSTYDNFHIYVLDNNSTDHSCFKIKEWSKLNDISLTSIPGNPNKLEAYLNFNPTQITLIENDENCGFGAGNNMVLRALSKISRNDFVWLLNPDTVVEPKVMEDLLKIAKSNQNVIVGNVIHFYKKRNEVMYYGGFKVKKFMHGVEDVKLKDDIHKIDSIAGASIFTSMTSFKKLGFLPENYFMYWEETDFCTIAKQKGYIFKVNSNSIIYDHVGASSKSNFLREYLYLLNGLRFYKKYYPMYMPAILLSTVAKYLKALLFEDATKQKAIFYAHIDFGKVFFGQKINVLKRIERHKKKHTHE
ncbi:glycosyltransferase family 2 protein [Psychroflexus montanilacus]|uniref:glycosyltransferase family 2 protein n=1 Tax=Psychroflexus montanilacus TaxID=2873598 RepID=UPI001CCD6AE8|nr:glycosyltransferase family 2 protein [Psychroflexus montanilacus]MBZ9652271.1 glycosyltransferase family 2 protein [Psychroflexus montanilacus]